MNLWEMSGAQLAAHLQQPRAQPAGQVVALRAPKPQARTYKRWGDFTPALSAARDAAIAFYGPRWSLEPLSYQWARLPPAWVLCHGVRSHSSPRDVKMPVARFWPDGRLPQGPEYAAPNPPSLYCFPGATAVEYLADAAD